MADLFLQWMAEFDPLPMARNPNHPARRSLELFLASRSLKPRFSRGTLARKVGARKWTYVHSKEWIEAGVFVPSGLEQKRLPWGHPVKGEMPERRGRPALLFRSVDPLEGRIPRPSQLRAVAPLLRNPLLGDALANSVQVGLQLLGDADGSEVFRSVARALDRREGKRLSKAIDLFERPVDSRFRDRMPKEVGESVRLTSRKYLPRLADVFESIPDPHPPLRGRAAISTHSG